MTNNLTKLQRRVLDTLRESGDWVGPTAIGLSLGFDYECASSRVTGPLKRLIALGKVERGEFPKDKSRVQYRAKREAFL